MNVPIMTTRRQFLRKSFTVTSMTCAIDLCSQITHAMADTKVKSQPDIIIYEGTYPGWPWITAGSLGTLYCVFREGTKHMYSPDGRIMFTRSKDKGKK